jgi:hypothetical protein
MKTLIIAITVLFLLGITLPSSKNIPTTDVVYMEEEGYIDDMPFNTSKIFKTLLN